MVSPTFLFGFIVVAAITVVIVAAVLRGLRRGGWMKIGLGIFGALIGSFAGFLGMFFLYEALPHHGCGVTRMAEVILFSLFVGVPVGGVAFSLIGCSLGSLLEHSAKENVAASDEEREQGSANPPP
jgi:hypothetical protein